MKKAITKLFQSNYRFYSTQRMDMDQYFEKMKKEGKNSVDNIVKWMKDSKMLDEAKATEAKARKLFEDAADKNNIDLKKFKEVITKMAAEQKKNADDLAKMLSQQAPKFLEAAQAGVAAFKDTLDKKK